MLEIKNRYIKYQEIFALKDRETTIVLQISLKGFDCPIDYQ